MIPYDIKQQILDAVRIDEVVGDFVVLKRRGTNLLGSCPFHQEKTPSFIVSPAKGIYKCFGCGKGGDSVSFVMEHEHFSYPEALKYLASKYGIEVKEEKLSAAAQEKIGMQDAMYAVSDFANNYFKAQLWESEYGKAVGLSYFRERGLSDAVIEKFQLGYCPDTWDTFTKAALSAGYSKEYLISTGLSIEKENKLYDRFRGRVMFPIHSLSGRSIAFGGRILGSDKSKAKYVNSPESDIYSKSKVLYGIAFAKSEISKKDMAYLVEGYTDVISLYQVGITNVVASSGTSLTVDQIKLVGRFTKNITILYDGDAAGIKASFRGIDMLLEAGMNVRVILFPDGHDPDSFAREHSVEEIEQYLKTQALDFIRFKTNLLLKEIGDDPIKRAQLIEEIVNSIALISDEIYRGVYIQECSRLLNIREEDLLLRLNRLLRAKFKKENAGVDSAIAAIQKVEEQLKQVEEPDSKFSLFAYERELLRLLLNYSERETVQSIEDESLGLINKSFRVCEYIVNELEEDELEFDNFIHKELFNLFSSALKTGNILSATILLHNESAEIRTLVADLSSVRYEISKKWAEKGIYVPTEEDSHKLNEIIYESVLNFKLKKVTVLILEVDEKLKENNTDELFLLLAQKKDLNSLKIALSECLRRVIY